MRKEILQSQFESQALGNKFCKFPENEYSTKISDLKLDMQENFKPPLSSGI